MKTFSNTSPTVNPYDVLCVDRKANLAEIKRAYFKLVREYPPEEQPDKFQEIRKAYEQLKFVEQRMEVDMFLFQPPPPIGDIANSRYDLTVHPEDLIRIALEVKLAELSFEKDFREPAIL